MKASLLLYALAVFAFALNSALGECPPGWTDDSKAALETAKTEGKMVLLDFTGSDWCALCIKLQKELFDQPKFQDYAKLNLVLVKVDFPHGKPQSEKIKEQNAKLKAKFAVKGFPTLILLDSEGKKLWESPFLEGGPDAFINALKNAVKKSP